MEIKKKKKHENQKKKAIYQRLVNKICLDHFVSSLTSLESSVISSIL